VLSRTKYWFYLKRHFEFVNLPRIVQNRGNREIGSTEVSHSIRMNRILISQFNRKKINGKNVEFYDSKGVDPRIFPDWIIFGLRVHFSKMSIKIIAVEARKSTMWAAVSSNTMVDHALMSAEIGS